MNQKKIKSVLRHFNKVQVKNGILFADTYCELKNQNKHKASYSI